MPREENPGEQGGRKHVTKQGRGDPGPRLVELECSPDSVERVMGQVARLAAVQ